MAQFVKAPYPGHQLCHLVPVRNVLFYFGIVTILGKFSTEVPESILSSSRSGSIFSGTHVERELFEMDSGVSVADVGTSKQVIVYGQGRKRDSHVIAIP
jgi:hypothetical protein